ncbi:MAG TPA: enoyl-CoA hydratase-related protein [Trebonia sp.]|jgi:2-(1,2-epoxy-1,2-dihydrophenyl)acetyl-CoA isomerase|nr:enoyl-CoA hydratase-related protein [Trebonia sp.]
MADVTIDTGTSDLLADVVDGVAVLTLNRPERRNAVSESMLEALAAALAVCETEAGISSVILSGAGGAFCSGGDVKEFAEVGALNVGGSGGPLQEKIERQRRLQRAISGRLHEMPKPTIACIDGAAAGAGLSLALACDLRVAGESAVLTTAFARVGLSGDYGVTWFLTRLLGSSRALELMLLSEKITAATAHQLGLVNRLVPPGEALAAGLEIARVLAAGPSVAYRAIKDNVNRAASVDLATCMDWEVSESMRCAATDDHIGAIQALAEHRRPQFRGR